MFRRDYLVKQLETFGKALALVMGKRQREEYEAYERSFAELTQTYAGKSLAELGQLSSTEFEALLLDADLVKKKILAALLFEYYLKSTLNEANEESEAIGKRCLRLYQNISEDVSSGEFDLDVHYKLQLLRQTFS